MYDKLEEYATLKKRVKILYCENNIQKYCEDLIIDFKTKNKEEFIILNSQVKIRLDRIIEVIILS